jgi:hypothetical protein
MSAAWWAWFQTIPARAATGILTYWLCRLAISGYDHPALGGPAA